MKEVDVFCPHNRPTESDFNKHTQDSQVHIGTSSQLPSKESVEQYLQIHWSLSDSIKEMWDRT